MERSLALVDSGSIGSRAIDKIIQAVVFFADSVAIRASYEPAAVDEFQRRELERRVSSLREQGFVRLWAHEYEVSDGGMTSSLGSYSNSRRQADLVVPQAALRSDLAETDELMRNMREQAYGESDSAQRRLRQGTAEIVWLRSQLASLLICSELSQDGLLAKPTAGTALTQNFRPVKEESFQSAVVTGVVGKLGLGQLSHLTPDQILECRRYSRDFRVLFDQSLSAVAQGASPVLTPEAVANEVVNRYRMIVTEYATPHPGRELGSEVFWDVAGATVPASMVLKYGLKALKWRKEVETIRPFLLLMQLERALAGDDIRQG
jgi:hypothetical protein